MLYNSMINREEKILSGISGEEQPITFNLSGPIQLVDSKQFHGVQLADAISAATVFAITNRSDPYAQEWLGQMERIIIPNSIVPDKKHVEVTGFEAQRNFMVLQELHSRSVNNISLVEKMPEFVRWVSHTLYHQPIPVNA